jgi:hypothetical protein
VTIGEIVKRRNNTYSKLKSIVPSAKSLEEEQINGYLKIKQKEMFIFIIYCKSRRGNETCLLGS